MSIAIQAVVSLDTKMFTAGIRGLEARINQFAGIAVMQFGGVAQQIAAMWGAFGPAGAAITALAEVTRAGADMEQQMARVASYTGMASDEIRALQGDSMKLAGEYGFAAHEIGNALANLALAGLDTKEALTDVLRPSLMLAKATLGDTQQAAEAITSTLKVFQLEMGQATHVADMFAGAIASSPLDMQRLTDAMKYAGPTASAFGIAMEKTVEEVAALHQVGLRGQMAGTIFRGAILEMAKAARTGAGEVGRALQGWDVATEGLTGAVRRLNAAGVDASIVIEEVGKRAGPGVAALMKLGADAMDDLATKVERTADVEAMHEKQVGTLHGQYEILQGKIAEVAQKIYDKLLPGLMECVKSMQDAVDFAKKLGSAFGGIGDGISAVMPLLLRLTTTILGVNAAIKGMSALGLATGGTSLGAILSAGNSNVAARSAAMSTAIAEQQKALQQLHKMQAESSRIASDIAAREATAASMSSSDWANMYSQSRPNNHLSAMEAATRAQTAYAKETARLEASYMKAANAADAHALAVQKQAIAYNSAAASAGALGTGLSALQLTLVSIGGFLAGVQIGDWLMKNTEAGRKFTEWVYDDIKAERLAAEEAKRMNEALQERIALRDKMQNLGASFGGNQEWVNLLSGWNDLRVAGNYDSLLDLGLGTKSYRKIQNLAHEFQEAQEVIGNGMAQSLAEVDARIKDGIPDIAEYVQHIRELGQAGMLSAQGVETLMQSSKDWAKSIEETNAKINEERENLKKLAEEYQNAILERKALESYIVLKQSELESTSNPQIRSNLIHVLEGAKQKLEEMTAAEEARREAVENSINIINGLLVEEEKGRQAVIDKTNEMMEAERKRGEESFAESEAERKRMENLRDALIANPTTDIDVVEKATRYFGQNVQAATQFLSALKETGKSAEEVSTIIGKLAGDNGDFTRLLASFRDLSQGQSWQYDDILEPLVKYGEKAVPILTDLAANGGTFADAERRVAATTKEVAAETEKLSADTVELADRFSAMDEGDIEQYTKGLKTLAKSLKDVPNLPQGKFAWVNDLKGFKLPKIDYISQGRFFADELQALATRLSTIDTPPADKFDWLADLKDFKLPRIDYVSQGKMWANELADISRILAKAPTVSANKFDWLSKLSSLAKAPKAGALSRMGDDIKNVADTLNSIYLEKPALSFLGALSDLAGIGNTSLLIGWKDNETLSSIDESLKTLAEMKGVIWA